ncbi:UNVERIFIED_CONTAM: hypothetical protein FKN15_025404, partial [Acipenser sinensis]
YDWIRNPFVLPSVSSCNLSPSQQESLLELSSERGLEMKFNDSTLTQFWCLVQKEYTDLGNQVLDVLLSFGSTYLCEVSFSAMTAIKSKARNRFNVEKDLIVAISSLPPRMSSEK